MNYYKEITHAGEQVVLFKHTATLFTHCVSFFGEGALKVWKKKRKKKSERDFEYNGMLVSEY